MQSEHAVVQAVVLYGVVLLASSFELDGLNDFEVLYYVSGFTALTVFVLALLLALLSHWRFVGWAALGATTAVAVMYTAGLPGQVSGVSLLLLLVACILGAAEVLVRNSSDLFWRTYFAVAGHVVLVMIPMLVLFETQAVVAFIITAPVVLVPTLLFVHVHRRRPLRAT